MIKYFITERVSHVLPHQLIGIYQIFTKLNRESYLKLKIAIQILKCEIEIVIYIMLAENILDCFRIKRKS